MANYTTSDLFCLIFLAASLLKCPLVIGTISCDNCIIGVTTWETKVFLSSQNSKEIRVYSNKSFAFERNISVLQMKTPYDIVTCQNSIYISEVDIPRIHRIELPKERITSWEAWKNGKYSKLSSSKQGTLLVCSRTKNYVTEYTSNGFFVRNITMDTSAMQSVDQVLHLDEGICVVSHSSAGIHQISVVDSRGKLIKSCGVESEAWLVGAKPIHLTAGRNGFIYVADQRNDRIVQLDSELNLVGDIIPYVKEPFFICTDSDEKRLYVAGLDKKRIDVYEIV